MLEFPSDDFEFKEDYSMIKANYLIKSIDAAFDDWQQGCWARGITFDEFCEYMLPYKCVEFQAFDAVSYTHLFSVIPYSRKFFSNTP